jgi:bla regulator protein BlaR1
MRSLLLYIAFIYVFSTNIVNKSSFNVLTPLLEEERQIAKHLPAEAEKLFYQGVEYLVEQLDGTGNKEIIVPYKMKDIENAIFLLVIQYDDKNSISYKLKGDGESIQRLEIIDINKDSKKEILVGTQMGKELFRLNTFSFNKNGPNKEFSYPYNRLEILDTDDSTKDCAFAFWIEDDNNCYKVNVVRWNGSELVEASDLRRKYFSKVVAYHKELTLKEKDNAFAWYYLADAQIKAGQKKEALVSIAKGVALNKDTPTKQEFEMLKRKCN